MNKWITFQVVPTDFSRKTGIWDVVTKGGKKEVGGLVLGRISWWSGWRKYAFFPSGNSLYEPTCLRDIAQFIDEQMAARKRP